MHSAKEGELIDGRNTKLRKEKLLWPTVTTTQNITHKMMVLSSLAYLICNEISAPHRSSFCWKLAALYSLQLVMTWTLPQYRGICLSPDVKTSQNTTNTLKYISKNLLATNLHDLTLCYTLKLHSPLQFMLFSGTFKLVRR